MRFLFLLAFTILSFLAYAQQVTVDTFWLANTSIPVQKSQFGSNAKVVFINLHANETTSVEATNEYLQNQSGFFFQLKHDTTRLVTFYFNNRLIQFDPNRIFTQKGRLANLKLLNRNVPSSAEKTIAVFTDSIVNNIKKAKVIVAMHNNTDKNLSVRSFKDRYVNAAMDPDDFILTTEKKIYDQLKKKKINVVLQTAKTSSDDGSLAIFCSRYKIPYINIEAQEGHLEQQVQMLNVLTAIINQYTH